MNNRKFKNKETNASTMDATNLKFPFVDDEGKLFDRFPLIILHLNSGDRVKLNYFTELAEYYKPTRYMLEEDSKGFIPDVEYKSYFVSPQWTCKEFLRHSSTKSKDDGVLQVSNNEFVLMKNVSKIEIDTENGDIICYKGDWNSKFFVLSEEPFVAEESDIVRRKKEVVQEVEKFDVDEWLCGLEEVK